MKYGINIMNDKGTMEGFENIIPMRDPRHLDNKEYLAMVDAIEVQQEEGDFGLEYLECYVAAPILDAKYKKVKIDDVITEQSHLSELQQHDLKNALEKY